MMKIVALCVLLIGLVSCQTYVVHTGFSDAKCTNETFTFVNPTACTETEEGRYQSAMCSTNSVQIMECTDSACSNCPRKESYNFSCNAAGRDYSQVSCAMDVPTGPHSLVQTIYPTSAGGCKGDFSVAFVSFDMIGMCNHEGREYVMMSCNTNGTITVDRCTDNMCSMGCMSTLLAACAHEPNGYTAYSCTA